MTNRKSEEPRHIPVESDEDNLSENQRKNLRRNETDKDGNPVHYEETPAGKAGLPNQKEGQDESQPPEEEAEVVAPIPGHLHR